MLYNSYALRATVSNFFNSIFFGLSEASENKGFEDGEEGLAGLVGSVGASDIVCNVTNWLTFDVNKMEYGYHA